MNRWTDCLWWFEEKCKRCLFGQEERPSTVNVIVCTNRVELWAKRNKIEHQLARLVEKWCRQPNHLNVCYCLCSFCWRTTERDENELEPFYTLCSFISLITIQYTQRRVVIPCCCLSILFMVFQFSLSQCSILFFYYLIRLFTLKWMPTKNNDWNVWKIIDAALTRPNHRHSSQQTKQ